VTTVPRESTGYSAADAVAGFLAGSALFLGALELFYRPFRLVPVAVVLLLVSTLMSRRYDRLLKIALAVIAICFVVGAALQVVTNHPLY
jgi:hypothetical protein